MVEGMGLARMGSSVTYCGGLERRNGPTHDREKFAKFGDLDISIKFVDN